MFLASVAAPGGEGVDVFRYVLAEKLGRTVAELGDMPCDEYAGWLSFHRVRAQQQELESLKARQAMRG